MSITGGHVFNFLYGKPNYIEFVKEDLKQSDYYLSNSIDDEFLDLLINKKYSFYSVYLRNEHKGHKRSDSSNVIDQTDLIFLDIDYHTNINFNIEDEKNKIISSLTSINITPNVILYTGGGFHLFIKLNKEYSFYELELVKKKIAKYLSNSFDVDKQALMNKVILSRIPNSINKKYNRIVKVIYFNKQINDISNFRLTNIILEQNKQIFNSIKKEYNDLINVSELYELTKDLYREHRRNIFLNAIIGTIFKRLNLNEAIEYSNLYISYLYNSNKIKDLNNANSVIKNRIKLVENNEVDKIETIFSNSFYDKLTDDEKKIINYLRKIINDFDFRRKFSFEILKNNSVKTIYLKDNSLYLILRKDRETDEIIKEYKISNGHIQDIYINYKSRTYKIIWIDEKNNKIEVEGTLKNVVNDLIDYIYDTGTFGKTILKNYILEYSKKYSKIMRENGVLIEYNSNTNKYIIYKNGYLDNVNNEQLREALLVLNEFSDFYDHKYFKTAMLWGLVSPLSYSLKLLLPNSNNLTQKIPYLLLIGTSNTGKTSLSILIGSLHYSNDDIYSFEQKANTQYQYAKILNQTTKPILFDDNILLSVLYRRNINDKNLSDIFKESIFNLEVYNSKGNRYLGKASSIYTANISLNQLYNIDEAILRRVIVLSYDYSKMKISEEQMNKYRKIEHKREILYNIGSYFINSLSSDDVELLLNNWEQFSLNKWKQLYREAGLEIPKWLKADITKIKDYKQLTDEQNKKIVGKFYTTLFYYLKKIIAFDIKSDNDAYEEYIDTYGNKRSKIKDIDELIYLSIKKYTRFMSIKNKYREGFVELYITNDIFNEDIMNDLEVNNLEELGYLLNKYSGCSFEYDNQYVIRKGKRTTKKVIYLRGLDKIYTFINNIIGEYSSQLIEDKQNQEQNSLKVIE